MSLSHLVAAVVAVAHILRVVRLEGRGRRRAEGPDPPRPSSGDPQNPGQSKVGQFTGNIVVLLKEEDVLGLDVAVDYTLGVQVLESLEEVEDYLRGVPLAGGR